MRIEDGKLVEIEETDIVNGTCTIPEGVTAIGNSDLKNSRIWKASQFLKASVILVSLLLGDVSVWKVLHFLKVLLILVILLFRTVVI